MLEGTWGCCEDTVSVWTEETESQVLLCCLKVMYTWYNLADRASAMRASLHCTPRSSSSHNQRLAGCSGRAEFSEIHPSTVCTWIWKGNWWILQRTPFSGWCTAKGRLSMLSTPWPTTRSISSTQESQGVCFATVEVQQRCPLVNFQQRGRYFTVWSWYHNSMASGNRIILIFYLDG